MIFVVTAVVALLAAEAVGFQEWLAYYFGFAVTLLLPSAFIAEIVYACGSGRAFGIGGLCAWVAVIWFTSTSPPFQILDGGRIDFCVLWSLTLAGGGVAVLVRRFSLVKPSKEA